MMLLRKVDMVMDMDMGIAVIIQRKLKKPHFSKNGGKKINALSLKHFKTMN